MSHFYAAIPYSARKTVATARGHVANGIGTYAASWAGKITVDLFHIDGRDEFVVRMSPHHGSGDSRLLAAGFVGQARGVKFGKLNS